MQKTNEELGRVDILINNASVALTGNNDQQVAQGRIEKTVPYRLALDETFDVGRDTGTPVVETYQVPFAFTGNLQKVTLNLN